MKVNQWARVLVLSLLFFIMLQVLIRGGSSLMMQIEKTQTLSGGRCQMASTGGTLKSSTAAARMDSPQMPFIFPRSLLLYCYSAAFSVSMFMA